MGRERDNQGYSLLERTLEISAPGTEPVLRNLLITQGYYEISQALGQLLGKGNSNWCTFGTWASRTAGRFIRKEELPADFRNVLEKSEHCQQQLMRIDDALQQIHPEAKLNHQTDGLFGIANHIVNDVTDHIAEGNRVVFREIATAFARFIRTFKKDTAPDPRKLCDFLEQFTQGEPKPDKAWRDTQTGKIESQPCGGQSVLRESLANYYAARFEQDPKRAAELTLLATVQGGVHEQTRLQTYIVKSMSAPFIYLFQQRCESTLKDRVPATTGLTGYLCELVTPLLSDINRLWCELATRALMTLKLPCSMLLLGSNIHGEAEQLYPEILSHLELSSLHAVYEKYGALTPIELKGAWARLEDSAHGLLMKFGLADAEAFGSAAFNWTILEQRMRYICTLFRSRLRDEHLREQPFTALQTADIISGKIPAGLLY